jgi:BMFP domain-containing protein YqiC
MQTKNPLLDDLAKLATGALGTLSGVRTEVESRVRDQLERVLSRMDLVTREEFEAAREMAAKARSEQELLLQRIAVLAARLDKLEGGGVGPATGAAPPNAEPDAPAAGGEPG